MIAKLVCEDTALVPGRTHTLGLRLEIEKGWHLYWLNPGDSGLPLEVKITGAPKGLRFGKIQWPAPRRYVHESGDLVDFVYDGPLTLLLPVTVNKNAELGADLTIKVLVSWLVCKEACVAGSGEPSLRIKVASTCSRVKDYAADFARTRRRLPKPRPRDLGYSWEGDTLVVRAKADRIEAFPYLPLEIPPQDMATRGVTRGNTLSLPYGPRIRGTKTVKVLVALKRRGKTTYHWLVIPAPKKE